MSTIPAPFFVAPPRASEPDRQLLLLSYHFPPAQTAGALRWQKMARFAAERGWRLDVVALDPAEVSQPDFHRLRELPPGTRVYGVGQPVPWSARVEQAIWRLYRRLRPEPTHAPPAGAQATAGSVPRPDSLSREEIRWSLRSPRELVRASFAWLDYARNGAWAREAARVGQTLARSNRYDAVVSCGPPHMVHVAGSQVARHSGAPFVMDLRDPWTLWQRLPESFASPLWFTLARRYERRAVHAAALVSVNTEPVRDAMRRLYPGIANRILTVMNGYDEEHFAAPPSRARFTLAYAGTVYIDRDPRPLFRAAARIRDEFGLAPEELSIEFMGHATSFQDVSLTSLAQEVGLEQYVRVYAPRPRREALEFLSNASVLLSLPQDSDLAIPSKVFEYMQFHAWILALAFPGSATELALRGTDADVVAPHDLDALTAVLRSRYLQFARGERPTPLASDHRFSRRTQATILFDALEGLLRERPPGSVRQESRRSALATG